MARKRRRQTQKADEARDASATSTPCTAPPPKKEQEPNETASSSIPAAETNGSVSEHEKLPTTQDNLPAAASSAPSKKKDKRKNDTEEKEGPKEKTQGVSTQEFSSPSDSQQGPPAADAEAKEPTPAPTPIVEPSNKPEETPVKEEFCNEEIQEPVEVNEQSSRENSLPPQPQYSYEEGSWTPFNESGRKSYSRNLLLEIKEKSDGLGPPLHLPSVDIVKKEPVLPKTLEKNPGARLSNMGTSDFTPQYMRGMGGGFRDKGGYSQGPQRGPNTSQQGRGGRKIQKVIDAPSASKQALKTTENAWTPATKDEKTQLDKSVKVQRDIMGMLNKLSPDNYNRVHGKIIDLIVSNGDQLLIAIGQIFEKAISEQHFSQTYARLCKAVTESKYEKEEKEMASIVLQFKNNLISRCQSECERTHKFGGYYEKLANSLKKIEECKNESQLQKLKQYHESLFVDKLEVKKNSIEEEMKTTTDDSKLAALKEELDYNETMARKRSIGLIKFIGELYKESLLNPKTMMSLITQFSKEVHKSLAAESLCKLFTTISEMLYKDVDPSGKKVISDAIERCRKHTARESIDSRTKFLLLDIVELFDNNFVAQHRSQKEVGPSTRKEVHNRMKEEEQMEKISLEKAASQNDRDRGDRRGGNRGSMNRDNYTSESSDVWKTVINSSSSSKKNSLRNFNARHSDNGGEPPRLGPGAGFSAWSQGASGGVKDAPKSENVEGRRSNRYGALQDDDMSGPDNYPMRNRGNPRFGPSRTNPFRSIAATDKDVAHGNTYDHRSSDRSNSMGRRQINIPSPGDGRNKSLNRDQSGPSLGTGGPGFYQVKKPQSAQPEDVPKDVPSGVDEEKVRQLTQGIIDEYCSSQEIKEAQLEIKEKFKTQDHPQMIYASFMISFDKKAADRVAVGKLFKEALESKLISVQSFLKGLELVMSEIPEISIDVPQVVQYVPILLVASVLEGIVKLPEVYTASEGAEHQRVKFIVALLQCIATENRFESFRIVNSTGFKMDEAFADELKFRKESLESFLEEQNLKFLLVTDENAGIKFYLAEYMEKSAWFKDMQSLKEAVRKLLVPCVKKELLESADNKIELIDEESAFDRLEALKQFLGQSNMEGEYKLVVLYAMQATAVQFSLPPGLLESLFQVAHNTEIVDIEEFNKWISSSDDDEPYKGTCVTSVRTYLRSIGAGND